MAHSDKTARFFMPLNVIRQKVGYGYFDPAMIERAEARVNSTHIDFVPEAARLFDQIQAAITGVAEGKISGADAVDAVRIPATELKAHAVMFKYDLISSLSGTFVGLLDAAGRVDRDMLEIAIVHQRILKAIISDRLMGHGGDRGAALLRELRQACERYHAKHKINTKN